MKKCDIYLSGLRHFTLLVDHQQLKPILNSKGIADVKNPRLQRLMMKMLPNSFSADWVKGKSHLAADALSHFPVDQPPIDDELCESHSETAVNTHFADKSMEDLQLNCQKPRRMITNSAESLNSLLEKLIELYQHFSLSVTTYTSHLIQVTPCFL